MTETRFDRYCQLTTKLGGQPARALLDKLQVLALTQPETLREIEAFFERGSLRTQQLATAPEHDRGQD
jgi:hypothetical protein